MLVLVYIVPIRTIYIDFAGAGTAQVRPHDMPCAASLLLAGARALPHAGDTRTELHTYPVHARLVARSLHAAIPRLRYN